MCFVSELRGGAAAPRQLFTDDSPRGSSRVVRARLRRVRVHHNSVPERRVSPTGALPGVGTGSDAPSAVKCTLYSLPVVVVYLESGQVTTPHQLSRVHCTVYL